MTQPTEHRIISRLLVANRGEIARRVFATCRRLGIETVAVHSDADAGLPFVADADLAVNLPGKTPAETYLDGAAIIAAAERSGINNHGIFLQHLRCQLLVRQVVDGRLS